MKGIILAGGSGTRLYPLTTAISKQLLPVYDKPLIYYPLANLMQIGIRDIMIISTPRDLPMIESALGDGSSFGIKISYKLQESPRGIAEAFILAEDFIGTDPVCLILGDNIFYGQDFIEKARNATNLVQGGIVFGYRVSDPERYGVAEFDENGMAKRIVEKPKTHISDYAITGIYFYDHKVVEVAKSLTPSARGELEITDVSNHYLQAGELQVETLSRGSAWLDAGTFDSLMAASLYVQTIEQRQGLKICCLEEIAYRNQYISQQQLTLHINRYGNKNCYSQYLTDILKEKSYV